MAEPLVLEITFAHTSEPLGLPYLSQERKTAEVDARMIADEGLFMGYPVTGLTLYSGNIALWRRNLLKPAGRVTPSPLTPWAGAPTASPSFPMTFDEYAKWQKTLHQNPSAEPSGWPSLKPSDQYVGPVLSALSPDPAPKK